MTVRPRRGACALMLAGIVAMIAPGACALFEDDPPDRTCQRNIDCFQAQGEVCDLGRKICVSGPDAGPALEAP